MTIERAILETLGELTDDKLLPEKSLVFHVNARLSQDATTTAIRTAAGHLEGRGQILAIDHEDKGRRYQITDQGRARLAS